MRLHGAQQREASRRVGRGGGGRGEAIRGTGERQNESWTEKHMDECTEERKTKGATNKGSAIDLEGVHRSTST